MFAIIKTGGKQYRITPGEILKIEALEIKKGKEVTFEEVLMFSNNNKTEIGRPILKNISVTAKVLENKKNKKILIFKKRRRHNSRRLNGHRQNISVVQISNISVDGKPINSQNKSKKNVEQKKAKKVIVKDKIKTKGLENGT